MATNSISARGPADCCKRSGLSQDKATALSDWLQAHAAAAALDSLAAAGDVNVFWREKLILQLPVQQMQSLRSLDLRCITVAVQGGANTQTAVPDLPPELLGITRLELWSADVGLNTLPAFTNLQHLALAGMDVSSRGLSSLLQLTHLQLSHHNAKDAVLASVSGLTGLQEIELKGDFYTADGLAALPASLTKLCVSGKVTLGGQAPDSTPAVAQLTALKWLEVAEAAGFSTAVLGSMSSLQHLAVQRTPLLTPPPAGDVEDEDTRGVDLAPLSGLTQLQHLELPTDDTEQAAADTRTNAAALTASRRLTCLIIEGLVEQQHYNKMFRKGRRLPQLKRLRATMGVLGTAKDAEALVRCCPNLEHVDLSTGE
jgi:hypothetical protein